MANMIRYFGEEYHSQHFYSRWLSLKYGNVCKTTEDCIQTANNIIPDYNFIGILELLDESLVVLTMLLDVQLGDALYLDSKCLGSYDDGKFEDKCFLIKATNVTKEMSDYLMSPEWQAYVEPEW
jgi:hypothetical protein